MKKQKDQQGFTIIEPLLVIVALAIVGFAGYYIYTANNNATDSYDAATQSSSTPVKTTNKESTQNKSEASQTPEVTTDNSKIKAAAEAADPTDAESTQDMQDASSAMSEE